MKRALIISGMLSLPLAAGTILNGLNEHQRSLPLEEKSPASVKPSISSGKSVVSVSPGRCEENDQKSLPLAYLSSLILDPSGKFQVLHDPRSESLRVLAPALISNCNSMIQWTMNEKDIAGEKAYVLEAKIRLGENCDAQGCDYKVARVEAETFREFQKIKLRPTLKGFEECLVQSGVVKDGQVDRDAIFKTPMKERFQGIQESGKLLLLSRGPESSQIGAKYGSFDTISGCEHYEVLDPEKQFLLSLEDEERQRLDAQAAELANCPINEYLRVADFIEQFEEYADQLGEVRDSLILEASKKAAAAIAEGKYDEETFQVIKDFEKYIIGPRVDLAAHLFEVAKEIQGDEKKRILNELNGVVQELDVLGKKPYFDGTHTQKLLADAQFDEAKGLNSLNLKLAIYKNLGKKIQGNVISPELAVRTVNQKNKEFVEKLALLREQHEIKTGQIEGPSKMYLHTAQKLRMNIQIRTENYTRDIQAEYARIQPGGYCYRPFKNTQRCIQQSQQIIQQLMAKLEHYNKVDAQRIVEYEQKAKEYGALEMEGRRYLAAQNGEESIADEEQQNTTSPINISDGFKFDVNLAQAPRSSMPLMPGQGFNLNSAFNMSAFSSNPQPFMQNNQMLPNYGPYSNNFTLFPQQAPNMNMGMNMGVNGAPQMYANPNQGFWSNPLPAYNNFTLF